MALWVPGSYHSAPSARCASRLRVAHERGTLLRAVLPRGVSQGICTADLSQPRVWVDAVEPGTEVRSRQLQTRDAPKKQSPGLTWAPSHAYRRQSCSRTAVTARAIFGHAMRA